MRVHFFLPLVLGFGLLAGCSSDGLDDLREFVKTAHADRKPKIEPLPEIKPYEAYAYAASDLASPFSPANLKPQSLQAFNFTGRIPAVSVQAVVS